MNIKNIFSVALFTVFISVTFGQYYPHRNPQMQQRFLYSPSNDNPFKRAVQNEGYYQRFTDYGRQRSKPLTQTKPTHNTYSSDSNSDRGKAHQITDKEYEDSNDYDLGTNLEYNDVTDTKPFDPFKYISDGMSGFEQYSDVGSFDDFGQHFDYNTDFRSK